jgi:hypothetical protein
MRRLSNSIDFFKVPRATFRVPVLDIVNLSRQTLSLRYDDSMESVAAPFIAQEALDEYASHAEAPANLHGQPGRFRGVTIFAWFVFAVAVVPTIISAQSASRSLDSVLILAFFGPFALFGFMAGVTMLRTDLRCPSIQDRSRPELAVRCYLLTIAHQNWTRASSIVAPIAVGETLVRPASFALNIPAETIRFRDPRDLQRYWSPILAHGEGFYRRLTRLKIRETHTEGPLHYLQVELSVRLFPAWAMVGLRLGVWLLLPLVLLTTQRHTIFFEIPAVKHKSQWWVAAAGIASYESTIASATPLPRAQAVQAR